METLNFQEALKVKIKNIYSSTYESLKSISKKPIPTKSRLLRIKKFILKKLVARYKKQ
jgi:hypothetical protein